MSLDGWIAAIFFIICAVCCELLNFCVTTHSGLVLSDTEFKDRTDAVAETAEGEGNIECNFVINKVSEAPPGSPLCCSFPSSVSGQGTRTHLSLPPLSLSFPLRFVLVLFLVLLPLPFLSLSLFLCRVSSSSFYCFCRCFCLRVEFRLLLVLVLFCSDLLILILRLLISSSS